MAVTCIMMMRQTIIAVSGHLVAITGRMHGQLNAKYASTRFLGGMRHASKAGQHQHQAGQQGKELAHHLHLIILPPRRNRYFSALALCAPA